MAVLQGVRLRTGAMPAARSAPARVSVPAALPSTPRVRPMGLLMAAIVIATLLALAYLTQTLGSNATSAEVRWHQSQQAKMKDEIGRHATLVQVKIDAEDIRAEARRLELKKLSRPVVLEAP